MRIHHLLAWAMLLAPLLTGCSAGIGPTIVEGRLKPRHFKFVTVVEKTVAGADGWRAACVHLSLKRTTGEASLCTFGVEVPIETGEAGPISLVRAQRMAANCANQAADLAFGATTAATPLGMACTSFIQTYAVIFDRALRGSRVRRQCHELTEPIGAP